MSEASYRLCRLRSRYDRRVSRVRGGKYGRLKVDPVPREDFFSRVVLPEGSEYVDYGEPEYRVVERLSIYYENEYLVTEDPTPGADGRQGVYAASENDPLLLCGFRGYLRDELLAGEFEAKDFPYAVSTALTGEGQVRLDDKRFGDGDVLDVLYEDQGETFVAVKRDYVNLKHRVYLPRPGERPPLTFERVDHSNVLYRSTSLTRNSYFAVPRGTLLVLTDLEDGMAALVDGDEVLASAYTLKALAVDQAAVALVTRANAGVRVGNFSTCPLWVRA